MSLYERLLNINKAYVIVTREPFAIINSNLAFAADEFQNSKKQLPDVALLSFRIVVLHPFAQGNKRTAFAAIELFHHVRDAESLKNALLRIANNPSIETEKGVKLILKAIS